MIEKSNTKKPIFDYTEKGYKKAWLFFESIGGYSLYHLAGFDSVTQKMIITRANDIWQRLKNGTSIIINNIKK